MAILAGLKLWLLLAVRTGIFVISIVLILRFLVFVFEKFNQPK